MMWRLTRWILIACAFLALFPLYTRYKVAAAPVPPGVYLGGLDLSDLKDPAEIRRHLEAIYVRPIDVRFDDKRLVLLPDQVDFHVDVDQMIAEAGFYLEGTTFLDIAVREALGFAQQRRDVPVRFMLNSTKLRAWLEEVAATHNHPPAPARLLPPTARWSDGGLVVTGLPAGYVGAYQRDWTWLPGRPGQTLDMEAAVPILAAAFLDDDKRIARLPLLETPAPLPTMDDLARELDAYLMNFPGFGAVYIEDLTTGAIASVDAEVAFSGMSTLKIGLATAIMARLPNGIDADDAQAKLIGQWIDYAMGESNNYAANQLLAYLGDGSTEVGAARFTAFMRELGMQSTFMQSGYDARVRLNPIPTPGNQRTDWQTNPDSNLQTTPAEIGRMLAALYECTQGYGLLMEVMPDRITVDDCLTVLFYLSHDEFQEMIWGGVPRPDSTWIVHKHGFAYESHSDVALVWGPTGPYVMSVFVFRRGWMDWETSNTTIKTLSRITWNFFEFQREQQGLTTPEYFILQPPPGYYELHGYIPRASTGYQ